MFANAIKSFALLLLIFLAMLDAARCDSSLGESEYTWIGTEVTSSDLVDVNEVRSIVGLPSGEVSPLNRDRFSQACGRVRSHFPRNVVHCGVIAFSPRRALFTVSITNSAPIANASDVGCIERPILDRALTQLANRYSEDGMRQADKRLPDADEGHGERLLDGLNGDATSKQLEDEIKQQVKGRELLIQSAIQSCSAIERKQAVLLSRYLESQNAVAHISVQGSFDSDEGVRNNAMRNLLSVGRALSEDQMGIALSNACRLLSHGLFLDVNKSLALIDHLLDIDDSARSLINKSCGARIAWYADTAISPQILNFATRIMIKGRGR